MLKSLEVGRKSGKLRLTTLSQESEEFKKSNDTLVTGTSFYSVFEFKVHPSEKHYVRQVG